MQPQIPSPVLAKLVGPEPKPRTEITKRLWRYIKRHGLQDTTERRRINANTPEFRAFIDDAPSCTMFDLGRFVNQHVHPVEG